MDVDCLPAFDPGEVQDRRDQSEQVLLALLNSLEIAALRIGEGSVNLPLQQLGVAEYRLERGSELVTQQRQEIGLRPVGCVRLLAHPALAKKELVLDPVGGGELGSARCDPLLELAVQLADRFLGLPPGGDVADDPAIFGSQVVSRGSSN